MSTKTNARRGRKPVAQTVASITLAMDANQLELADNIASDMPQVLAGLRPKRGDVLRTAIERGLQSMRAEIDQRLAPTVRAKR